MDIITFSYNRSIRDSHQGAVGTGCMEMAVRLAGFYFGLSMVEFGAAAGFIRVVRSVFWRGNSCDRTILY